MAQDIVKIELVSDGDGSVIVFKNGQPIGTFYCEYSLAPDLKELLTEELVRFYYPDGPIV